MCFPVLRGARLPAREDTHQGPVKKDFTQAAGSAWHPTGKDRPETFAQQLSAACYCLNPKADREEKLWLYNRGGISAVKTGNESVVKRNKTIVLVNVETRTYIYIRFVRLPQLFCGWIQFKRECKNRTERCSNLIWAVFLKGYSCSSETNSWEQLHASFTPVQPLLQEYSPSYSGPPK